MINRRGFLGSILAIPAAFRGLVTAAAEASVPVEAAALVPGATYVRFDPVYTNLIQTLHTPKDFWQPVRLAVNGDFEVSWTKREVLAQEAFPELSLSERELLISQTCGPCFDELFGGEL